MSWQCGCASEVPATSPWFFKQHDRLEPHVTHQVIEANLHGPQHKVDLLDRLLGQNRVVLRGFNDDFVGAAAAHVTEQRTVFEPAKVILDSQGRKLIRNHPHSPAGHVRSRVAAQRVNFRRGHALVAGTERAGAIRKKWQGVQSRHLLERKRPARPRRCEDHPVVAGQVVTENRHRTSSSHGPRFLGIALTMPVDGGSKGSKSTPTSRFTPRQIRTL